MSNLKLKFSFPLSLSFSLSLFFLKNAITGCVNLVQPDSELNQENLEYPK